MLQSGQGSASRTARTARKGDPPTQPMLPWRRAVCRVTVDGVHLALEKGLLFLGLKTADYWRVYRPDVGSVVALCCCIAASRRAVVLAVIVEM